MNSDYCQFSSKIRILLGRLEKARTHSDIYIPVKVHGIDTCVSTQIELTFTAVPQLGTKASIRVIPKSHYI